MCPFACTLLPPLAPGRHSLHFVSVFLLDMSYKHNCHHKWLLWWVYIIFNSFRSYQSNCAFIFSAEGSSFSRFSQTCLFILIILVGVEVVFSCDLNCIFFWSHDFHHLFMCLLSMNRCLWWSLLKYIFPFSFLWYSSLSENIVGVQVQVEYEVPSFTFSLFACLRGRSSLFLLFFLCVFLFL